MSAVEQGSIARIGELIRTQDNHITSHPVFVVEQQRTTYAVDTDYDNDGFEWLDDDGIVHPRKAARLERLFQAGGNTAGYRRLGYKHHWEFVTACFTWQGCEDYLAVNGHNLSKTRIFVYSGWRNAEWQALREHLVATPPQVSGGGVAVELLREFTQAWDFMQPRIISTNGADCMDRMEALEGRIRTYLKTTPQARPDGGEAVAYADSQAFANFKERGHLGGVHAREWMWAHPGPGLVPMFLHAAPAPRGARLAEALRKVVAISDRKHDAWDEAHEALREYDAQQSAGGGGTPVPDVARLVEAWEARARSAHPSDAMLINKHIRELREAFTGAPQESSNAPH